MSISAADSWYRSTNLEYPDEADCGSYGSDEEVCTHDDGESSGAVDLP